MRHFWLCLAVVHAGCSTVRTEAVPTSANPPLPTRSHALQAATGPAKQLSGCEAAAFARFYSDFLSAYISLHHAELADPSGYSFVWADLGDAWRFSASPPASEETGGGGIWVVDHCGTRVMERGYWE